MSLENRVAQIVTAHRAKGDTIVLVGEKEWSVSSTYTDEKYLVEYDEIKDLYICNCKSYMYRSGVSDEGNCKHILAVKACETLKLKVKTLDELMEAQIND